MNGPLVSPAWLAARLPEPGVVVVDVRWYLSGKVGRDEYAAGHLPGAAFVELDRELALAPSPGRPGRHPLPTAAMLSALLARLGVRADSTVVAYDDAGGAIAARLWWLLDAFGHGGGRVLDGGIAAWRAAGLPIVTEVVARAPAAPLKLALQPGRVVDREALKALAKSGAVVLDARAAERYEGKLEPIDRRPGHIPGALSAPFSGNLQAGSFLEAAALVERYSALGALGPAPVIAYCGSGVTACHTLLALTLAGRPGALLYEGSWSDWAAHEELPAALGPGPG